MTKPSITKRSVKGAALTYNELDTNFQNLADATLALTAGTGGTQVTSDLNGNITLVAGTGISLSGNNTSKEITITSTSGSNSFSTIAVSGQSNVVADSTTDTLTLVAGSNVSITTDAAADSVTIAASVTGITNPLTSDLDLGSYLIKDTNSAATIKSTQGLMVKSNSYTNAEVTITPGDISNAVSRLSSKEGPLTINVNNSGYVDAYQTFQNSVIDINGSLSVSKNGTITASQIISSTNTAGSPTIDRSGVTASYANGATVNFSDFSGMVMINRQDTSSGNVALWLCGGGVATKLGDSQANASGTISGSGAVNGYVWTNNTGVTITASFMLFRGRTGG